MTGHSSSQGNRAYKRAMIAQVGRSDRDARGRRRKDPPLSMDPVQIEKERARRARKVRRLTKAYAWHILNKTNARAKARYARQSRTQFPEFTALQARNILSGKWENDGSVLAA